MIKSESYKSYCETLGEALREYTKEAIEKKKQSMGTTTESFQTGYLSGFHRIIVLWKDVRLRLFPFSDLKMKPGVAIEFIWL